MYLDAVYAEAVVTVHEYDIILDFMIINQTDETLQNLSLELSTVSINLTTHFLIWSYPSDMITKYGNDLMS